MGSSQRLQAVLPGALDLDGPTEPPHWDEGPFYLVIECSCPGKGGPCGGGSCLRPRSAPRGDSSPAWGGGSQLLRHVKALCPGRCRGVWGLQPGLALAQLALVPLPFSSEAVGPEGTVGLAVSPQTQLPGHKAQTASGHGGHTVRVDSGHLHGCLPWSGRPLPPPAPAASFRKPSLPALLCSVWTLWEGV